MKNLFKKAIALITLISMLTAGLVLPSNATLTTADVTTAMNYYAYNVYQSGRYWDGGNINVSYATAQCNYRVCTCNTYQGASQCHGFALYLSYLLTGSAPKGTLSSYKNGLKSGSWTCYTLSALGYSGLSQVGLQPGDIVRAATDSSYKNGHTAVVWKIENGRVYFAECWGDRHCKLNWGGFNYYSYSLSAICSRYSYVAIWRNGSIVPSDSTTPPIVCQHNYLQGSDASHPHAVFMKCSKCAETYYTGENTKRDDCPCCQGVHTWDYLYESVHPHAEMQSCIGCGVQSYTGNAHFDPECAVCTGVPYNLSVNTDKNELKLGQLVSFDLSVSNADERYLEIYKNGILHATLDVTEVTDVNYRTNEAGIYSARLRAVNANGENTSDMSLPFVADADVVGAEQTGGVLTVKYSDPVTRDVAEEFCRARGGELADFGADGFSLRLDVSEAPEIMSGDVRYILYSGAFSWTEAHSIAQALGGTLATVLSDADSAAISTLMTGAGADSAWLGASDTLSEGDWFWTNSSPLDYVNWNLAHSDTVNTYANWLCTYRNGQWCEEVLQGRVGGFILEESTDFTYTLLSDGSARIDRFSAHTGAGACDVVIPDELDGFAVSALGADIFTGREIARVTLPGFLSEIEGGALDAAAELLCPRDGTTRMILDGGGVAYKFAFPFTDVARGKWYEDAVRYCYGNGLIEGTSSVTFDPSAEMTRAMFVTVLCSMAGADRSQYPGSSFADVAEGKWYASSVEWAYRNGLAAGDAGNFNPSGKLSRQELATFMFSYARFIGEDVDTLASSTDLANYTDVGEISSWAELPMTWAVARGILSGTTTSTLSPTNVSTRAQVAQICMKFTSNVAAD